MTVKERFLSTVYPDPNSGCWIWEGSEDEWGYGRFTSVSLGTARAIRAPRAAYLLFVGPIPPGGHILHSCDLRLCVNPDHLRLGSHADNMRDMALRGRADRRGSFLPLGVRVRRGRISGEVKAHGKTVHLGTFATIEEAAAAVREARRLRYQL